MEPHNLIPGWFILTRITPDENGLSAATEEFSQSVVEVRVQGVCSGYAGSGKVEDSTTDYGAAGSDVLVYQLGFTFYRHEFKMS